MVYCHKQHVDINLEKGIFEIANYTRIARQLILKHKMQFQFLWFEFLWFQFRYQCFQRHFCVCIPDNYAVPFHKDVSQGCFSKAWYSTVVLRLNSSGALTVGAKCFLYNCSMLVLKTMQLKEFTSDSGF